MTQLVLGTEIMLVTAIIIFIELLLLSFFIISWISRPNDLSRRRFLFLTLYFLGFNIIGGLFPDKTIHIPLFIQYFLIYGSAIAMASYFFFFLSKEFDFKFSGFFNAKLLSISLSVTFLISYGIGYLVTGQHKMAYYTFIGFPIFIACFYCWKSVTEFRKRKVNYEKDTPFKTMYYAGFFGVLLIAALPFESVLGGHQAIEILTVNTSYFLLARAYIKRYVFSQRMEYHLMEQTNNVEISKSVHSLKEILSSREMEIAYHLVQSEKSYNEIADLHNIAPKTIGKHASNIFKKTEVQNRLQFISKYSNVI